MEPKVEAAPIFELPAFPGEDQARQIASAGRISHAGIDGPGRAGRIRISGITDSGTRYWEPTTVLPRLGQGSFRLIVTDSYDRRCAFTNSPVLHVLEAAHIRPHGLGGTHAPTNGLLIRQDFHTLFDRGYMTVTPEHHVEVSSRIKQEFDNGREYYALHGKQIRVPQMPDRQPSVESLSVAQRKRLQTVTLGSNQGRWLVERVVRESASPNCANTLQRRLHRAGVSQNPVVLHDHWTSAAILRQPFFACTPCVIPRAARRQKVGYVTATWEPSAADAK